MTADLMETVARTLGFPAGEKKRGRRDVTLLFKVPFQGRTALFFDFNGWLREVGERGLEPIYAAFFLACGVMSNPATGRYRLAFSPSAGGAIQLMTRLFSHYGLARNNAPSGKDAFAFYKRGRGRPLPSSVRSSSRFAHV